jgi:hypothetical protein
MIKHQSIVVGGLFVALLCAMNLHACKIPVFRYALERWPADRYAVVALVDGEVTGDAAEAVSVLRSIAESDVNIVSEVINLAELTEAELWQVEGIESTDQTPLLQVFYPEREGQRKVCWTGPLTPASVDAWIDSPIRTQIVNEVQSGVSAVWVLVEGPDEMQNQQLLEKLETALAEATKMISIPDGVIDRQDAGRFLTDNPDASMDDVLRSDVPLQIKFSTLRLGNAEQSEMAFRAIVNGWTDTVDAPFVFPVFGRGRMIEPLSAADFDESSVIAACRYLVGECSCSVKALNPGVDLILKADWQAMLGDQVIMIDAANVTDAVELSIPSGKPVENVKTATPSDPPESSEGGSVTLLAFLVMAIGAVAFSIKLRMGLKP